jgi:hypothetical protein
VNQEQRLTISRLDEKSLDAIYLDVFLLAGYCHTVVLLKNESAVRSCASNLHVLPNKELEAAQTCLNRRLVNLTVPLTAGNRGIATCFQVSCPEHFLLLLRFGERARSEKEKHDYPEEFPIHGLSPFYRNGYVTKRCL